MRFLIKVAFWLSIVVLLLPADSARHGETAGQQVGALEAFGAAQAAVEDATDFCARRPEACEVGAQAFQTFGEKAQYGAKLLYEFLSSRFAAKTESSTPIATGSIKSEIRPGRHTLTPADMAPAWHGPDANPVPVPPRRPS